MARKPKVLDESDVEPEDAVIGADDDVDADDLDETELDVDDDIDDIVVVDDVDDVVDDDDVDVDDDDDDDDDDDEEADEALEELEAEELELLAEEAADSLLVDEATELREIRRAELGLNIGAQAARVDEFVCSSCFLVKRTSQLANKRKLICRDCV
jgi:hypothetical protein